MVMGLRAAFARLKGNGAGAGEICVRRLGELNGGALPPPDVDWKPAELRVYPPIPPVGPELLIRGNRRARTWREAAWLAGTSGDGLYLAESATEARALKSIAGKVRARGFGGAWSTIGRVKPCES